jgi:hypothetical protein
MSTVSDEGPSRLPPPQPIQLGEGGPLEWVGPETHVHKITNIPFLVLGLNDFDASKSIT